MVGVGIQAINFQFEGSNQDRKGWKVVK